MTEEEKLVHGWKDGRPVVGRIGEVEVRDYTYKWSSCGSISSEKFFLASGLSNESCVAPLNNLYHALKR